MPRGGPQPGSGRPRGHRSPANIQRERARIAIEKRINAATSVLMNAQLTLATGQTFLYKIEKEFIKTGTTKDGEDKGYWRNKKPVQVTAQSEIEDYLEGLIVEGDMYNQDDPGATYYYITAKEPNNMAIDSLINRVHGKPKESLDISGEVKFSLKELARRRQEMVKGDFKIIEQALIEEQSKEEPNA